MWALRVVTYSPEQAGFDLVISGPSIRQKMIIFFSLERQCWPKKFKSESRIQNPESRIQNVADLRPG